MVKIINTLLDTSLKERALVKLEKKMGGLH
jgi:hypothetical protein